MKSHTIKTFLSFLGVFAFLFISACGSDNNDQRWQSNGTKRMSKADMVTSKAEVFLFDAENFDLGLVTDLIKGNKVKNLEELEARINNESSGINNVDIDNDQIIDLILVRDGRDEATGTSNIEFHAVPSGTKKEDDATLIASVVVSQKDGNVDYSANYPDYAHGYKDHSYHYRTPHVHGSSFGTALFLAYMFRPHYSPYYMPGRFMYPVGYHRGYMSPSVRMSTRNSYRSTTSTTRTVTKTTRSKNYKPSKSAKAAQAKTRSKMKSGAIKPNAKMAARNKQANKSFKARDTSRKQKAASGFGGKDRSTTGRKNSRSLGGGKKTAPRKAAPRKSGGFFGGDGSKSRNRSSGRSSGSRSRGRRGRR